jgi:hypothetical protein
MRSGLLLVASSLLLLLPSCKSPCRALSEKLCDCRATTVEREQCARMVSQEESSVDEVTAEDEARCQALLEDCDCRNLQTAEGKRACGLAR